MIETESRSAVTDVRQRLLEQVKELTAENEQLRAAIAAIQKTLGALQSRETVQDVELFGSFSVREREVLVLIAGGVSTKAIAYRLGITFKTAVSHRTRLLSKLGIHDISGVTRFAIRIGLIQA